MKKILHETKFTPKKRRPHSVRYLLKTVHTNEPHGRGPDPLSRFFKNRELIIFFLSNYRINKKSNFLNFVGSDHGFL